MTESTMANTIDSDALAANSYKQMVDYLENILTRQLEKVRGYDLDGAMNLAEEANSIAANIGQQNVLDMPEFKDDRWRLERLYKDLCLVIAAEREEVGDKLRQIRQGIKALGIYADNV